MTEILLAVSAALFLALGMIGIADFPNSLAFVSTSWVLIVFLFFDLRYWRVPRKLAFASLGVSFGFGFLGVGLTLEDRVTGALSGFLFLWCLLVVSTWALRRFSRLGLDEFAIGAGDPLMLCVIGSFFGYLALSNILFLASVQAILLFWLPRIFGINSLSPPWASKADVSPLGAFMCLASLELLAMPDLPSQMRGLLFA